MRLIIVILFLQVVTHLALGQLTVDFNAQLLACKEEQIQLSNTSNNTFRFEWDFCAHDSETILSNSDVATITGISGGYGYKIVNDGSQWFGFAVSQSNHSIYRLDFGDSPLNIPVVNNLGNPGSSLSFPNGIEMYYHGGNWFGFVGLYDPGAGIIRLDFGSSLMNTPTAQNLGMFGLSGRFWGARVIEENGNLILIIINRNTNSIIRVNYRDSFYNSIDNATHVVSNSIASANLTPGFDVVYDGISWVAVIASDLTNALIQIRFPNGILNAPVNEGSYTTNINRPSQLKLLKEGTHYLVAVTSEFATLKLIDYKDLNPVNPPTEINHGSLPSLLGIDLFRYKGKSILNGVGTSNKLRSIVFESNCDANFEYSEDVNPQNLFYTQSGTKHIELSAYNEAGLSLSTGKDLIVGSEQAPQFDFQIQNICANHNTDFDFLPISGALTNFSWSFGDTQTSTDPNPTHQYSSSGGYDVSLTVTAENGCNNYAEKTISIYDEPIPDFQIPATNPLCTNQNYVFDNISTTDPGYPVIWQWKVNGADQSVEEDLQYTFTQPDNQTVTLSASIPGCENSITKPISTLTEGPLVNFSFPEIRCEDDAIAFTNASSGSVTAYSWNFGDGNSSTDVNAQHIFATPAQYDVTLTASNSAGCINFSTKPVQVFSKPAVAFNTSNLCNGRDAMFSDITAPPTDSNIQLRQWNFGDAASGQNTSTLQNPVHTFANTGEYTVQLMVTTSASCSSTLEQPVTIKPSPVPDFTFSTACADKDVNFLGSSTGVISIWDWQIGNPQTGYRFGDQPNITYSKISPGSYTARLSVTADNGCFNYEEKDIEVKNKLAPDFSFLKNCINEQTIFTDITNATADPINTYQWSVAGEGTATGSPATFTFPTNATRSMTLTVVTESGCDYSKTKQVPIIEAPHASFEAFPPSGGIPLLVQFTNTSSGANSYVWKFKENAITTAVSPSFTYNEVGEYEAELTAYNAQLCSDVVSMTITAEEALEEIALMDLKLRALSNAPIKPSVTIVNNGNVSLNNLTLLFDISGVVVKEYVDKSIRPDSSWVHVVKFEVPASQELEFLCAEVESTEDVNRSDNKVCLNIEDVFTAFTPYPNPTNDKINVEWILNEEGMVTVSLINAMGMQVKNFEIEAPEGFSPFTIDTEDLHAGVYLVRVTSKGFSKTYKLVVQ